MDIGNEVRRYRAEPVMSPVPGAEPAPSETVPAASVPAEPVRDGDNERRTQEAAVEAHA